MFKREFIPGWALLIGVALASTFSSELVVLGGKHPLEASAVAVVLGIAIRNLGYLPERCRSGVSASEKLLVIGIVLMGAGLNISTIVSQGAVLLAVILITMALGFFLIVGISRVLGLPSDLGLLLGVGTTICGTSAIAVTAPLIKAKQEEISYAIGTVALWGLVAILLYPLVGELLGVSDNHFGIFAGVAIHSTPQVIGAGYIFSDQAGQIATAIKLVRNCFMAPVAILIALWHSKRNAQDVATKVNIMRAFPWFLFGYFFMAALNSWGLLSGTAVTSFTETGKFLILLGMAGVGLNTNFAAFRSVGLKPLVVGLVGSLIVAAVSIVLIAAFIP